MCLGSSANARAYLDGSGRVSGLIVRLSQPKLNFIDPFLVALFHKDLYGLGVEPNCFIVLAVLLERLGYGYVYVDEGLGG